MHDLKINTKSRLFIRWAQLPTIMIHLTIRYIVIFFIIFISFLYLVLSIFLSMKRKKYHENVLITACLLASVCKLLLIATAFSLFFTNLPILWIWPAYIPSKLNTCDMQVRKDNSDQIKTQKYKNAWIISKYFFYNIKVEKLDFLVKIDPPTHCSTNI